MINSNEETLSSFFLNLKDKVVLSFSFAHVLIWLESLHKYMSVNLEEWSRRCCQSLVHNSVQLNHCIMKFLVELSTIPNLVTKAVIKQEILLID